ncbi:MAG: hypothetical protein WCA35_05520, partial [Kovacikia sp.]
YLPEQYETAHAPGWNAFSQERRLGRKGGQIPYETNLRVFLPALGGENCPNANLNSEQGRLGTGCRGGIPGWGQRPHSPFNPLASSNWR